MLSQGTGIGAFYNQLFEAVTFLIKVYYKVENKACFPFSFQLLFVEGDYCHHVRETLSCHEITIFCKVK